MDEIIQFLKDGTMPQDSAEARRLRTRAARYTLIDEVLFNKGFSLPLLRCLREDEAKYTLGEVHEGVCGNHMGAIIDTQNVETRILLAITKERFHRICSKMRQMPEVCPHHQSSSRRVDLNPQPMALLKIED
ncbi:rve domain-containing [Abeliophyllum distichum]|uniref:Rve domain-containing n=1 Tax=Abeliophyllum distichum TaxID=126358 RepID=A0ABD1PEL8_9LAMI